MVQLDEGNIEISWECPPCHAKSHPEQDPEPPQQTVAKLPPRARATPTEPVTPAMTMPRPILPSNGVNKLQPQTNGGGGGGINNGMNFPDVSVRDLPFYPVKATLLKPCTLVAKKNSTVKSAFFSHNSAYKINYTNKHFQDSQNQNLAFYLTQEQANIVNNGRKVESNGMVVYKMHILLRFTKKSPDGIQDDDFPKNVILKVNNKVMSVLLKMKA